MRYRVAAINYLINTFRRSHLVVDTEIWAVVGSFIAQEACFTRSEPETRRHLLETAGWVQCPSTLACSSADRAENEKDAYRYSDLTRIDSQLCPSVVQRNFIGVLSLGLM